MYGRVCFYITIVFIQIWAVCHVDKRRAALSLATVVDRSKAGWYINDIFRQVDKLTPASFCCIVYILKMVILSQMSYRMNKQSEDMLAQESLYIVVEVLIGTAPTIVEHIYNQHFDVCMFGKDAKNGPQITMSFEWMNVVSKRNSSMTDSCFSWCLC